MLPMVILFTDMEWKAGPWAGAGVALPHSAISGAHNPAGMVHVGYRIDINAAFFSPRRDYETSPSLANGMGGAFTIVPNDIRQ